MRKVSQIANWTINNDQHTEEHKRKSRPGYPLHITFTSYTRSFPNWPKRLKKIIKQQLMGF